MSTTLMTEPAAGWYHDPADAGAWRWWDGAAWTDHVRAMQEGGQPVPALHVVPDPASEPQMPAHYQPVPTHPPVFEPVTGAVVQTGPAPISAPTPIQAPAPAPAQATPTGAIPQPGQVAPTPTPVATPAPSVGGSVSMTPETPISDQMYWHSAAAEVIEVPRLPSASGGSSISPRSTPSYVRDWNDLGSPNTAGIWLLAFLPVIGVVVNVAIQVAMMSAGVTGRVPSIVGSAAVLLLAWTFAGLDARALAERGYHAPRLAWMLLFPPLAYLIARGKTVRRESKRAWPPELVYVLNVLGVVGVAFAATLFLAAVLAPYLAS